MPDYVTSAGRRLSLGKRLGGGGEAEIFHVSGDGSIAVKLYTDGKQADRRSKIDAMVADNLREKLPFVALPIEPVLSGGAFVGFTMRKAAGARPLHELCTPGDRKRYFPAANYRFLVRVALNFARAVASVHQLGAVIGDINESVALVNPTHGLVTIIDSDSFQYRHGSQLFHCIVGKAEYTPPELQGQNLTKIVRTVNHDAFGLAVVIFEILFMGRHPFSGRFKGAGEQPPIAKAIEEGRFAYSPQKALTQMEPPPHAPTLRDVPMEVADAFQKAFGSSAQKLSTRPTPAEWVALLERMESGIIECTANAAHYYSRTSPSCPWCRFEKATGATLFNPRHRTGATSFDFDGVLARIELVQSPGAAPDLASLMPYMRFMPSEHARGIKRRLRMRRVVGMMAFVASLILLFTGFVWGIFILTPAAFLLLGEATGIARIRDRRAQTQREWATALAGWDQEAGAGRFEEKKQALRNEAAAYRALPSLEKSRLQMLETRKRELQLQRHLENHKLGDAKIDGIGDGRKITLRSYGIECAWDIIEKRIMRVPGFGTVLTGKLTAWRQKIEARFKFNPGLPTDAIETAGVRSDISLRRDDLKRGLLQGAKELEILRLAAFDKRDDAASYQAVYLAMRQGEIDASLLK